MPRIFIIGYPSHLGGADTELWHTLRMLRVLDRDVAVIPTWRPSPEWRARCDGIGVETIEVAGPDGFRHVANLAGATVLSFCNGEFLRHAGVFRELGCRIVWIGCMTWMFASEREHYERYGTFDAYVFQSDFQRSRLLPELRRYGVREDQCHLIRGAFDPAEFPYRPLAHEPRSDFVVGRMARSDRDKWSANTWPIYGAIPYAGRRARLMGWNDRLAQKLGAPPDWAEVLAPCAESSPSFLKSLHCLVSINGGAAENWPRVGLEAMSSGVPVVAENQWGWREMIVHGETGFLANNDQEFSYYAAYLAMDEQARLRIARNARIRLMDELVSLAKVNVAWHNLLESLTTALPPAAAPVLTAGATNGRAVRAAHSTDLATAAEAAWLNQGNLDLSALTLREAFERGFSAGQKRAERQVDHQELRRSDRPAAAIEHDRQANVAHGQ